jgi:hypothetical protein
MLDLYFALLLAFVAGIAVKAVDWIDDEKKGKYSIKWPLALIYGGLIGVLISQASFSTIFLAALFAQVFARKIDTHTHVLGFAFALLSLFYLGFPPISIELFVFFAVAAYMDEARYFGRLRGIIEYRPFLKIAALIMLVVGRMDYFLGIMAFDIGYTLFDFSQKRVFKLE